MVKVVFQSVTSYRGKTYQIGQTETVSEADAIHLVKRRLAFRTDASKPREKVIVATPPKEKRIESVHTGAGWYELRQGETVLKRVRGADNANKELEKLLK